VCASGSQLEVARGRSSYGHGTSEDGDEQAEFWQRASSWRLCPKNREEVGASEGVHFMQPRDELVPTQTQGCYQFKINNLRRNRCRSLASHWVL
jgi:hypothetical protein